MPSLFNSSHFLHSGFGELAEYASPFSPLLSPPRLLETDLERGYFLEGADDGMAWNGGNGVEAARAAARGDQARYKAPQRPPAAAAKRKGRIDKRMIGPPTDFRHVLHASTYEEATELLLRWSLEGVGDKLGDPRWARPVKELIKTRAREQQARAVAAVVEASARSRVLAQAGTLGRSGLHVVNGLPSSIYSTAHTSVTTRPSVHPLLRGGSETPALIAGLEASGFERLGKDSDTSPPRASKLRNPFDVDPLEDIAKEIAGLPISSTVADLTTKMDAATPRAAKPPVDAKRELPKLPTYKAAPASAGRGSPSPTPTAVSVSPPASALGPEFTQHPFRIVKPSLPTLEKAMSVALFFEQFYHALLRPVRAHAGNYVLARARRAAELEASFAKLGVTSEDEKNRLREELITAENAQLRDRRRRVDARAFDVGRVIGHGAFGVVRIAREKETGRLVAMKQLRKADMLRKAQEGHVRAEKDLLAAAASISSTGNPWIVQLFYAFQDVDHLYLVLEYMGGGDLLNLLVERDTFSEPMARFYVAEMVLALEQTHALGYIHRDIKPDNFLFTPEGHIRVSDFGLATDLHWAHDTGHYEQQRRELLKRHGIDLEEPSGKSRRMKRADVERVMGKDADGHGVLTWRDKNRRKLAYSVCGTNSYMAPEVIRGQGYGFSCDWWSLGIIMYESLYGYPPFSSSSRHVTRQKILDWKHTLRFPPKPQLSPECTDLLVRLLCEPEDRIGAKTARSSVGLSAASGSTLRDTLRSAFKLGGGDGAGEIKAHSWFKGIDWADLHNQTPPYHPDLRADDDTRHFDDDIPAEPLAPANGAAADATRDPLLGDRVHGARLLEIRKSLAFAGWTFKAPLPAEKRYGHLARIASGATTDADADAGADALDEASRIARVGHGRDDSAHDHFHDASPTLMRDQAFSGAGAGTVRSRALSL
ncbi:hypothetical protein Q5752_006250 [Cryptotrichosporon argae]